MKLLRNTFIFILVFELAFPKELSKLIFFFPDFLEHYEHHKNEHHEEDSHQISFLDFISEHWALDINHHTDKEHPDKNHCPITNSTTILLTFLPENFSVNFSFEEIDLAKEEFTIFNEDTKSHYLSSIWQPPKTV